MNSCSYIWLQGVGYGTASRLGEGSLTKMSPLQVTDQIACLEGGPWIPLESQHDTLSNASWRQGGGWWQTDGFRKGSCKMCEQRLGEQQKNYTTPLCFSLLHHIKCMSTIHSYPIMHLELCGCCQPDWPPLFGAFRGVDSKSVFGVI